MGHGLDGLDTDFWDVKCYLEKSASSPSDPRPIVVVCEGRLRFYKFSLVFERAFCHSLRRLFTGLASAERRLCHEMVSAAISAEKPMAVIRMLAPNGMR